MTNQKERDALVQKIGKDLVDKGMLIEAGFAMMCASAIHPDAPPDQIREMRMAFFAGAQHLFGTIMNILDPGKDPTDADLRRMDQIDAELKKFISEFAKRTIRTEGSA